MIGGLISGEAVTGSVAVVLSLSSCSEQKNQLQAQRPPTINMLEFGNQMAELKELNEFESSMNWTSSMI
jgi:hypothetical protein